MSSIHLYAEERFYPGSGEDNDEMCGDGGIINIGLTPIGPGPWDAKGVIADVTRLVLVCI